MSKITLGDIKFGEKVFINGYVYEYAGQEKVNFKGVKKSQYVFNGVSIEMKKTFDVSAKLRFREYTGREEGIKFELY